MRDPLATRRRTFVIILLGGLALAGCGSSGSAQPTTSTSTPTTISSLATTTTVVTTADRAAFIRFVDAYNSDTATFDTHAKAASSVGDVATLAHTYSDQAAGFETQLSRVQWPSVATGEVKTLVVDLGSLSGDLLAVASEASSASNATMEAEVATVLQAASTIRAQSRVVGSDLGVTFTN